jgi:hypothetical protein
MERTPGKIVAQTDICMPNEDHGMAHILLSQPGIT